MWPAWVFRPRARAGSAVEASFHPLVGQLDRVGHRGVGQRPGGGVRHGAGHVRDAVVDRVVHLERRVGVRGGARVLEAAALVDGDVDEHRAGLHLRDHLVGDELGGLGAGDEHGADDEVGAEHLLLDRHRRRGDLRDAVVVAPEAHPQLVEVGVEQRDVGAHAERDVRGVLAGDAGADDDDLGVGDAADAAHEHAAAALGLHHRVGADLGGEAARDLGHRVEQRQEARGQLHRLVRDGGDLLVDELLGERLVGGEVEVGEQGQALTQAVVLLGHRLLDLHDHVRLAPHVVGGVEDRGALRDVLLVGDRGAEAGTLLDEHVVTATHELVHPHGGDADPELVVLDLAGDPDLHGYLALSDSSDTPAPLPRRLRPGGARCESRPGPRCGPTTGGAPMKLYSDIPARRVVAGRRRRRASCCGWCSGCASPSASTTRRWRSPSRGATSPAPARSFRGTMTSAGDNVDDLPLLEDRVATPFRSAAGVGTEIEQAGNDLVSAVERAGPASSR